MTRKIDPKTDAQLTFCILLRCYGVSYAMIGELSGLSTSTIRYHLSPKFRKQVILSATKFNQKNPEQLRKATQRWVNANRDRYNARHREYQKNYRRTYSLQERIAINLRQRIRSALKAKGLRKTQSTRKLTGCSPKQLRLWLEAQFESGMTWANYGKWHIDHIRPFASFDLTDPEQLRRVCHFSNLQPLWAEDNLRKGAKPLRP